MVQKTFLVLAVMVFSLEACKIDRKKTIDRDKFTFLTTSDRFLFFRNVRQIYYDRQEIARTGWIAYRHADRQQSDSLPVLNPVIVVDWMKNEASILIEPNAVLFGEAELVVRESRPGKGQRYGYSLKERGRENMLEFATKIYEGIMEENDLRIRWRGAFHPLFRSEDDAETFRTVMADYYRLTGVF